MPNLYPAKRRDIVFGLTASLLTGSISAVVVKTPGFSVTAQTGSQLAAKAPGFSGSATMVTGVVMRLDRPTPGFSLDAQLTVEDFSTASLVAPGFRSVYGVLDASTPAFTIRATLIPTPVAFDTANYATYAMNLANDGVTDYSNYPFEFIQRFEGKYYGFNANGAYLLEGVDDDGTAIDCGVELPPLDFGSSRLKRLPYVYVGCDSPGKLKVTATVDEETAISVTTGHNGRNRRAKIPKGLVGRFWSPAIHNLNGNALKVDSIELLPSVLRRKV